MYDVFYFLFLSSVEDSVVKQGLFVRMIRAGFLFYFIYLFFLKLIYLTFNSDSLAKL